MSVRRKQAPSPSEGEQAVEPLLEPERPAEPEPPAGLVEAAEVDDEAAEEVAPSVDGQPKKKRTRRGSRGGRGRKKPDSVADAGETPADGDGRPAPRIHVPSSELGEADGPAKTTPRKKATKAAKPEQAVLEAPEEDGGVVVVDAEAGEPGPPAEIEARPDGQPKRKRSRRGSRGGRRRKPAGAAADQVESHVEGEAHVEGEGQVEGGGEIERANGPSEIPEYVPMSEWIDDFESRSRA